MAAANFLHEDTHCAQDRVETSKFQPKDERIIIRSPCIIVSLYHHILVSGSGI